MEASHGPHTTTGRRPGQDTGAACAAGTSGARWPGLPGRGGSTAEQAPDLVTVPVRRGLEAVDILRRGEDPAVGPVLHDGPCDTVGFLVPPGTAAAWDVPGSACTGTDGRGLRLPSEPPAVGAGWLLPPGATDGPVTDPARLRQALDEAARTIEAADSHS
ncbi:hypothetical protein [Streptomyces sp. NRRL F-5126]|uniref:hypothetical protein n=1 Tax=Streptomyces sp. NRRL F-5126 TaxID=1463857 RepID=UPI003B63F7BE